VTRLVPLRAEKWCHKLLGVSLARQQKIGEGEPRWPLGMQGALTAGSNLEGLGKHFCGG